MSGPGSLVKTSSTPAQLVRRQVVVRIGVAGAAPDWHCAEFVKQPLWVTAGVVLVGRLNRSSGLVASLCVVQAALAWPFCGAVVAPALVGPKSNGIL